jgi:Tol biopolymer transport system component
VLALPEGKPLYAGADGESALGGFTWTGPKRLAFLDRPPPKQEGDEDPKKALGEHRLMEIDLTKEPPTPDLLQKAVADESYGPPSASADGRYIALSRYSSETISLALFDRNEKKLSVFDIAWRVDRPALSPDGKRVAFERGGDIAIFTFDGAKTVRLTENPSIERYPLFALDGRSVFFESRSKDPNFSSRNVSAVGTVQLP